MRRVKDKPKKKQTDLEIFREYCRYDSGSYLTDSGGHYGRHHEQPAIPENSPGVFICDHWGDWVGGAIETGSFLASFYEVDHDLMGQFNTFIEDHPGNWFQVAREFMESLGHHRHARDNVCNRENDMTQVFVWEVWTAEEDEPDWIYADDSMSVIFIHTGCDIRGGYSRPIFCRPKNSDSYTFPLDIVCGWYADEGRKDGKKLDYETLQGIDEEWEPGYSENPSHHMSEQIERVFGFTRTKHSIVVKLKTGELLKIGPNANMEW